MPIIGKALEGRQYSTDGGNNNVKTIAIEAPNGDASTAASATPFLEFTNAKVDGSDKDGSTNLTTYAVSGLTPGGSDVEGGLISINGVQYYIPVYKAD